MCGFLGTGTRRCAAWRADPDGDRAGPHVGRRHVKLFLAPILGPSYLLAVGGVARFQTPLVPTGGASADNATEWLEAGAVALGVGGSVPHLRRSGDQDATALRTARGYPSIRLPCGARMSWRLSVARSCSPRLSRSGSSSRSRAHLRPAHTTWSALRRKIPPWRGHSSSVDIPYLYSYI